MSVQYRYRCQTENTLVWETRTLAQGPPTVCVNESGAIVAGTLTVLDKPKEVADLVIGSTIDFSTATVSNLSHGDLDDGEPTHTPKLIHTLQMRHFTVPSTMQDRQAQICGRPVKLPPNLEPKLLLVIRTRPRRLLTLPRRQTLEQMHASQPKRDKPMD